MKTVPKIVAIGGGEIREQETAAIDKRIIELTGKTQPKALFIPTASSDAPGYIDTFETVYGKHFGCQTHTLKLVQNPPVFDEMAALVLDSDLVYVEWWKHLQNDEDMATLEVRCCVGGSCVPRYCSIGSQCRCDLLV